MGGQCPNHALSMGSTLFFIASAPVCVVSLGSFKCVFVGVWLIIRGVCSTYSCWKLIFIIEFEGE